MPSRFAQAVGRTLDRALDQTMGEAFEFRPMQQPPNGRVAPDPQRQIAEVIGLFDWPAIEGQTENLGLSNTGKQSRPALLSVDANRYPAVASARQGDRFLRIGTGEEFEIVMSRPDGLTRIEFNLIARRPT